MAKNLLTVWPKIVKFESIDGSSAPHMLAIYSTSALGRRILEDQLKLLSVEDAVAITNAMLRQFVSPKYRGWAKMLQKTINRVKSDD